MKFVDYDEKYSFEKPYLKSERVESGFFSGKQYYYVRCFNVDGKTRKFDFGVTSESKPQKFFKGFCRVPYKDGWEYQINVKFHLELIATLRHYENKGFAADGSPTAYLRHNRRALGIHYLMKRYIDHNQYLRSLHIQHGKSEFSVSRDDFEFVPYFPTPEDYEGWNKSKRSYRYSYSQELEDLKKELHLELKD